MSAAATKPTASKGTARNNKKRKAGKEVEDDRIAVADDETTNQFTSPNPLHRGYWIRNGWKVTVNESNLEHTMRVVNKPVKNGSMNSKSMMKFAALMNGVIKKWTLKRIW